MALFVSSGAAAYHCHNSGKCCQSYQIGVDPEKKKEIAARVEGIDAYAGQDLFDPGVPGSFINHAMLKRPGGKCVFFRDDALCDLHGRFGEEAKPLVCLQYPFIATGTPRGVSVGLFYSCPSAVLTLREASRFEILEDPPGFKRPVMTKQVPTNYPLWFMPGRALSWEFHQAIERWILASLQNKALPLRGALWAVRQVLETASTEGDLDIRKADPVCASAVRSPADLKLQRRFAARFAERRGKIGIASGGTDLAIYKTLVGLLGSEGKARPAWDSIEPAWEGVLRRYLCGKVFANMLFIEYGMIPAYQSVLALHCLAGWVLQALSDLSAKPMDLDRVCEAIEYTERLFPHDDKTFSLWSREEAAYETTGLDYARILLA